MSEAVRDAAAREKVLQRDLAVMTEKKNAAENWSRNLIVQERMRI